VNDLERQNVLVSLIAFAGDTTTLSSRVRMLPWNSESELARIGVADLASVLFRFADGELRTQDLEMWAELVEGRDDIGIPDGHVADVISRLANPVLEGRLTRRQARELARELDAGQRAHGDG